MKLKLTDPTLRLRPIQPADMDTLLKIYGSTREKEMERVPQWSDLMKKEFLASQFRAQHEYYQKNYIGADFWVIEKNNKTIGRLYFQEDHHGQTDQAQNDAGHDAAAEFPKLQEHRAFRM